MDIRTTIENLRKELNQHNYNYYVLDNPTISDFDFDLKLKELQQLEAAHPEFFDANSPTQRVGGAVTKNFETFTHNQRMYSLENCYSIEELIQWEKRIQRVLGNVPIDYMCELKYDGASISITYENGKLVRAVTRGDGFQGDVVTTNIKTIRSIPLELKGNYPTKFDIRGEIILPIKAFNEMNEALIDIGEQPFSNPRNTASGSLKLQDSSLVAKRPLECLLYSIVPNDDTTFSTQEEALEAARSYGFKVPKESQRASNLQKVIEFIEYWNKNRENLHYETDGVVVKVNPIFLQEELGHTAKNPRWAIAYKFQTERAETTLEDVVYQVGRTGAITPVAQLTPVQLAGTIVKRASLYNADQIEKLGLCKNDAVFVEKGGEIIPKIVGVNTILRASTALPITYATHCPECGSPLIRKEGESIHYCLNSDLCPPQIIGKIEHFISRKAMNIDGIGAETVKLFFDEQLIRNYADLYDLKKENIIPLERMAEKSAQNIIDGIEKSKEMPFEKVLFALGIRYVGETSAKKLAIHFKNIDALATASYEELVAVDEIGDKLAQSILQFFSNPMQKQLIERLKNKGLQFETHIAEKEQLSDIFAGQTLVVSGKFSQFSRDSIKQTIEAHGGKIGSSISNKTHWVVAGSDMGPAKLEKAKKLNIPILSEEEFIKKINH